MARYIDVPLTFHAVLPAGTSAGDLVTEVPLKGSGKIVAWSYTATVAATGAGATRTLNLEIGTTNVTSTATALALADADAVGETKTLTAPTAANEYKDGDLLSIEVAAGGTAFTAGEGFFTIWLRPKVRGI